MSDSSVFHHVSDVLLEHIPDLEIADSRSGIVDGELEFFARLGPKKLLIEIKEIPQIRIQNLVGQLSAGALQAKHFAKGSNAVPVVVVFAPRIGQRAMQEAQAFMDRFLAGFAWCLIDKRGRIRMVAKKLGIDINSPFPRSGSRKPPHKEHLRFSDLNRWLLKILLLSDVDESLWRGPKEAIFSPGQLQHLAGVSLDKAYKFVRAIEKNDFLRRTPGGMKLIRRRELVELWFSEEKIRPARRIPVRSILGKKPDLRALARFKSKDVKSAVGGFSACRVLGVLHAPVESIEVHIASPVDPFLERFKLEACDERAAQLNLIASRHGESIFRGTLERDGMRVVDVFQAALDVVNHPARGLEQAEYIVELILGGKEG